MKKKYGWMMLAFMIVTIMFISHPTLAKTTEYTYQEKYHQDNNTVTIEVYSEIGFKATKPTWTLDSTGKYYSKTFEQNQIYSTPFTFNNGEVENIEIKITKIDQTGPAITMEYRYDNNTNTVTGIMHANERLKNTKISWILSEDGLTYTTTLKSNGSYTTTVEDIWGNQTQVLIKVTQIDETGPEITMEYRYDNNTNTVTGIMHANERLKNTKISWVLSADGLTYTTTLKSNGSYTTTVEDIWGNQTQVLIKVTQIDETGPELKLSYQLNAEGTITAIVTANEQMKNNKPSWQLAENGLTFTKIFENDQNYSTYMEDQYGNQTHITLNFKTKNELFTNSENGNAVTVVYLYDARTEKTKVTMFSQLALQNTKPTWQLSGNQKEYTKEFTAYQDYETDLIDVQGSKMMIHVFIDYYRKDIFHTEGTYGDSGLKIAGDSKGTQLAYYQYGEGPNVLFATFAVHGFEDKWAHDGEELVKIANQFYERLKRDNDVELGEKWTVYIFPEVNPDGRNYGYTNNGPGRTTLFSQAANHQGIDINRCWQVDGVPYTRYTDARNFNGTQGFQSYEASALKNFLLNHQSKIGQTILIDLHGWTNQLIGDSDICMNYYYPRFKNADRSGVGRYGTGYLVNWARSTLRSNTTNAKSALIELPSNGVNNPQDVLYYDLPNRYIESTLAMLNNISVPTNGMYRSRNAVPEKATISAEEQYQIALAGMVKQSKPEETEIKELVNQVPTQNGIWVSQAARETLLQMINENTNSTYSINEQGYLELIQVANEKNEIDLGLEEMISSSKQYKIDQNGISYAKDIMTKQIQDNPFEKMDAYQTYEYVENGDEMAIILTKNEQRKLTNLDIITSLINLTKTQIK